MTKQNKINNLVIGSDGFIGNALCAYLEKLGENVVRFDIKRSDKEDARKAKLPLRNIDRVYFLAWEVGGSKYLYKEDAQLLQLEWNVALLTNTMPQLERGKIPFVFVSSQLADETNIVYGATKNLGELWTKRLGGVCVRLWNPYGGLEKIDEKSHVIADFINQALTVGKIQMMTTGEERRQFTHLDDVCAGLHYVIENNMNTVVYDLTTFEWTPIKHMADLIGKYAKVKVIPGKQKGVDRTVVTLKGKPSGWSPKITLEEGVKMMVEEARLAHDTKNTKSKKI